MTPLRSSPRVPSRSTASSAGPAAAIASHRSSAGGAGLEVAAAEPVARPGGGASSTATVSVPAGATDDSTPSQSSAGGFGRGPNGASPSSSSARSRAVQPSASTATPPIRPGNAEQPCSVSSTGPVGPAGEVNTEPALVSTGASAPSSTCTAANARAGLGGRARTPAARTWSSARRAGTRFRRWCAARARVTCTRRIATPASSAVRAVHSGVYAAARRSNAASSVRRLSVSSSGSSPSPSSPRLITRSGTRMSLPTVIATHHPPGRRRPR